MGCWPYSLPLNPVLARVNLSEVLESFGDEPCSIYSLLAV